MCIRDRFTDDYLQEEMNLTEVYLKPPDAEAIRALMLERPPGGDIRRAADYFKLVRYSFSAVSYTHLVTAYRQTGLGHDVLCFHLTNENSIDYFCHDLCTSTALLNSSGIS